MRTPASYHQRDNWGSVRTVGLSALAGVLFFATPLQAADIIITLPDERLKQEMERACTSRLPCRRDGTTEERLQDLVNILIHVGSSFYGASYQNLSDLEGTMQVIWETP